MNRCPIVPKRSRSLLLRKPSSKLSIATRDHFSFIKPVSEDATHGPRWMGEPAPFVVKIPIDSDSHTVHHPPCPVDCMEASPCRHFDVRCRYGALSHDLFPFRDHPPD